MAPDMVWALVERTGYMSLFHILWLRGPARELAEALLAEVES